MGLSSSVLRPPTALLPKSTLPAATWIIPPTALLPALYPAPSPGRTPAVGAHFPCSIPPPGRASTASTAAPLPLTLWSFLSAIAMLRPPTALLPKSTLPDALMLAASPPAFSPSSLLSYPPSPPRR
ncbi:hypothetical protein C8R43DRAFT_1141248 [Mycena crocata]|nr:hypothetical protein C8R43DRAFT_1141248 [Mycena crocata]